MKPSLLVGAAAFAGALFTVAASAAANPFDFDGATDFAVDSYGYYYEITGGKFPTGNIPNGDNASGGTFRFLTDSPDWGGYALDTWHKDDWFPQNAGIALTLQDGGTTVYDNNGIEDGTYGDYYNATAQGVDSAKAPGLYRGYSMDNIWDWVYAGYFLITKPTQVDTLIGYFDANSGFDPNNPAIGYAMNIWSNVDNDLLPTNTGSFNGDVFHIDSSSGFGTLSTSDTGVDRVFGADYGSATDDILRLTASLNSSIVLDPGIYWFSSSAYLKEVPEPATVGLMGVGLMGIGFVGRRRRA